MAPNDSVIKNKIENIKVKLQNEHLKNLYPAKKVVDKAIPHSQDKPVALQVVSSEGKLLSAAPVYQEVKVGNSLPSVNVKDIPLVENQKGFEVDKANGELLVKITKGMTFEKIMKRYLKNYSDMKMVADYNGIHNINKLKVNVYIRIPKKYLNSDYKEQFFPEEEKSQLVAREIKPLPTSQQQPLKAIQVKQYKLKQLRDKLSSLEQRQKENEIKELKSQVNSLKALILKMNAKLEKKVEPVKPKKLPKPTLKKVSPTKNYQKVVQERKVVLQELASKLEEKNREKRLQSIREKLLALRKKYFEKVHTEKKVMEDSKKKAYQKEIQELKAQMLEQARKLSEARAELKRIKAKKVVSLESYKKIIAAYKKKLAEKEKQLLEKERMLDKLKQEQSEKIAQTENELKKLKNKKTISPSDFQKTVRIYKQKLAEKEKALFAKQKLLNQIEQQKMSMEKRLTALEKEYKKIQNADLLEKKYKTMTQELERRKDLILKLNKMLSREKKEKMNLLSQIKSLKKEIEKIKAESKKSQDKRYKELESRYQKLQKRLLDEEKNLSVDKSIKGKKLVLPPSSAERYYQLAMEYWKKGLFVDAISEYKKAVRLNPAYLLKDDNGLSDAAIQWAQSTLKNRKGFLWELRYKLAQIYQKKGYLEKALIQYKDMLKEDPNNAKVYFNMGLIFEQMKNYRAAVQAYEKISSLPSVSDKYVRMATDKLETLIKKK
jgi:hypothetical protein